MKKLEKLLELMKNNEWQKALALARRFPNLGKEKDAIILGHESSVHRNMYIQLKKDPDLLFRDGVNALLDRFGHLLK